MLIKKLLFAPFFLIFSFFIVYSYRFVLDKYLEVFFGKWAGLWDLGLLALLITFTALSYCLFVTFTQDIKYAAGLILVNAILPFFFLPINLAVVISLAISASLLLGYFNMQTNLKTYLNFRPTAIVLGPLKTISTLMLFSLSIGFYLQSNSIIQTQGFKIPDPIVDWAIDMSLANYNIPVKGEKYLAQVNLTPEQAEALKQNPQILEQFGLNSSDVDQFIQDTPQASEPTANTPVIKSQNQNAVSVIPSLPGLNIKDIVKAQITDALDQMVQPYLPFIPFILAFLFYSLTSLALWIISIFISPIISILFSILEKTGFVRFEKEMREIRKLVI